MGDGIMAVFGAPIESDDHADRALAAAREMVFDRLPKVNAWLREQTVGVEFRMGVGLNSGPVMSGNVGSEKRLEYTTIGDTTNTASRIEGMTKGTGHSIFMSQTTVDRLRRRPDDLIEVGELEVRGRSNTVRLWSVPELQDEPAAAPDTAPAAATL
jgi:adenylate cyclase